MTYWGFHHNILKINFKQLLNMTQLFYWGYETSFTNPCSIIVSD